MNSFNLIALIIFTLTALTSVTVNGLECWMCKGNINSGCNSPFIPELFAKKKCADNEKVCLKVTQNVNGETFHIRSCGVLDANTPNKPESMGCKDVSDKGLPTVEECICNSDGCNGSSQLIAYSLTSILPIIIFSLLVA
ncbi:uncharacterized protein LOC107371601 isoform X2 [Tetranychus urticae]|uniref:Uncharacterized protein n=1 Tax=Tetranychus urticae TaxID=32264 RepID=T1JY73_TETUR|nr:uncharacterized protein LOC107371601 isoform X2 [Tetranychus urticae]